MLELNKTYHAALVYDGSMLKFYRNGALISQRPASENLITNDWYIAFGEHAPVVTPFFNGVVNPKYHNQNESEGWYDESFRGFINEVRIWKVARNQNEIKSYINTSLPNLTSQIGLLGYWVLMILSIGSEILPTMAQLKDWQLLVKQIPVVHLLQIPA